MSGDGFMISSTRRSKNLLVGPGFPMAKGAPDSRVPGPHPGLPHPGMLFFGQSK